MCSWVFGGLYGGVRECAWCMRGVICLLLQSLALLLEAFELAECAALALRLLPAEGLALEKVAGEKHADLRHGRHLRDLRYHREGTTRTERRALSDAH